jgi:hypothetical protein
MPPSEDSGGTFSAHEAGVGVTDGRLGEGDGDICAHSAGGVTVAEVCRPWTPGNSPADGDKEVWNVHGYEWVEKPVLAPVGGPVSRQPWRVRALSGIVYYENMHALNCGDELHPYEYFLTMFPMDCCVKHAHVSQTLLA